MASLARRGAWPQLSPWEHRPQVRRHSVVMRQCAGTRPFQGLAPSPARSPSLARRHQHQKEYGSEDRSCSRYYHGCPACPMSISIFFAHALANSMPIGSLSKGWAVRMADLRAIGWDIEQMCQRVRRYVGSSPHFPISALARCIGFVPAPIPHEHVSSLDTRHRR